MFIGFDSLQISTFWRGQWVVLFDNSDDPGYPTNLLGLDDGLQVVVVVVEPNYRAISEPTYSRGMVEKPDYKTNFKL